MLQILILRKTKKHRPRSYCIPHVIRFKAFVNDRKLQKIEITFLHLIDENLTFIKYPRRYRIKTYQALISRRSSSIVSAGHKKARVAFAESKV